jgi:hypothetical protein
MTYPSRRGGKPATTRLIYDMALLQYSQYSVGFFILVPKISVLISTWAPIILT